MKRAAKAIGACFAACLIGNASAGLVEVIGHRGNPYAGPENTIATLNSAFAAGADHVEADIRLTSDGVAVLMHDASVNRTTNGTGAISGMTLAQVKALDAGSWFDAEFTGEQVPTLAEALVAIDQRGRLLLHIKVGGMGAAIQDAINEATATSGKTFTASDMWIWPGPNADYEANVTEPSYLLGSIPSPATWQAPGYFDSQKALGVVGWDVSSGKMTAAFAAAARAEGMMASVYTVNTESAMRTFIAMGVTAMETDHPAVLAGLLNQGPPPPADNNILINGDFETGDLTDWSTDAGTPEVLATGTHGIGAFGSRFFGGGNNAEVTISQTIDVSANAEFIDAGTVEATLAGALGSWENTDIATVTLSFLGGSDADLGSPLSITSLDNPVVNGRDLKAAGNQESDTGFVPAGTRTISVVLTSIRGAGNYNDGFADNLSVQLLGIE